VSNPSFPLRSEQDRARAIQIIQRVDLDSGKTWQLKDAVRSDGQNRKMWAALRDISRQVEWYGQKLDEESWKCIFSASVEKQRAVPAIDGSGFVVLGVSTRNQSKAWFSDMLHVMDAFAAEQGVKFTTADYWGFE
jgi:hypothetical protein